MVPDEGSMGYSRSIAVRAIEMRRFPMIVSTPGTRWLGERYTTSTSRRSNAWSVCPRTNVFSDRSKSGGPSGGESGDEAVASACGGHGTASDVERAAEGADEPKAASIQRDLE